MRRTAEHEVTSIAAHVFERFPDGWASLEAFRRALNLAAQDTSWYQTYLHTREERSVALVPFHRHLVAILDELGWSTAQLADRLDVDRTNVYDWVNGTSLPLRQNRPKLQDTLSAALGWPVTFVFPPESSRTTKTPRKRHPPRH